MESLQIFFFSEGSQNLTHFRYQVLPPLMILATPLLGSSFKGTNNYLSGNSFYCLLTYSDGRFVIQTVIYLHSYLLKFLVKPLNGSLVILIVSCSNGQLLRHSLLILMAGYALCWLLSCSIGQLTHSFTRNQGKGEAFSSAISRASVLPASPVISLRFMAKG